MPEWDARRALDEAEREAELERPRREAEYARYLAERDEQQAELRRRLDEADARHA